MLNDGKFSCVLKSGLWAEAASTATLLENNLLKNSLEFDPLLQLLGKGKRSVWPSLKKLEKCAS